MKILIIGGHLAPALAVIDEIANDNEIIFAGRQYTLEGDNANSLEYETITGRRITFVNLITGRVQRKISKHTLSSLMKIPYGLMQSVAVLNKYKPDVVLGFGGYLSVPVGIAAYLLGIPLIIHEQTLEAGLANKLLAHFAKRICISWKSSARYFPQSKTVLTGNPVKKFTAQDFRIPLSQEKLPLVYITGGSSGAHAINSLVESCLTNLLQKCRIIHQTGSSQAFNDYNRLNTLKNTLPLKLQKRYYHNKFITPDSTGVIMDKADLIISRSGINTVSELLFFGKPCLLIPLPYGQRNEQLKNAQFMKKTGMGEYLIQQETDARTFLTRVEDMLDNIQRYRMMASEAKSFIHKDSAENIIKVIYETVSKGK